MITSSLNFAPVKNYVDDNLIYNEPTNQLETEGIKSNFRLEDTYLIDDSGSDPGSGINYRDAVSLVTGFYQTYLGRSPDSGGLEYWASAVAGGGVSPYQVMIEISNSPEATNYTHQLESEVNSAYRQELGRDADIGGLSFYVNVMRSGFTIYQVKSDLHNSSEGIAYRNSQISNPPPVSVPSNVQIYFNDIYRAYTAGKMNTGEWAGKSLQEIVNSISSHLNMAGNGWERDPWGSMLLESVFPAYTYYGQTITTGLDSNGRDRLGFDESGKRPDGTTRFEFTRSALEEATGRNFAKIDNMGELLRTISPGLGNADRIAVNNFLQSMGIPFGISSSNLVTEYTNQTTLWSSTGATSLPALNLPAKPVLSFDAEGFSSNGYDIMGYNRSGYNSAGYDEFGVNSSGYFSNGISAFDGLASPPALFAKPGTTTTIAKLELSKLPESVQNTLYTKGVQIVVVRAAVTEHYKDLLSDTPTGHTSTWKEIPGIFRNNFQSPDRIPTVVIASSNTFPTDSFDYRLHEIGHAYDWAAGAVSDSADFLRAFHNDRDKLSWYPAGNTKEAFAEVFANYYGGNTAFFSDKPSLLNYAKNFLPAKK